MVPITIQKLFVIQMLIGQNLPLIKGLLLGIVSPLVVTDFLEEQETKCCGEI